MTNELMERVQVEITDDQLVLIKKTVAKDATNDELQLYFYDCKRRGVHPLDKKIHFTKRGGKYVPIVGIDFLREQAAKTGQCGGISDPVFAGKPMQPDFAATVTVKRVVAGMLAEFTATARWSEYCPASGQDHMWKKMPHTMLGKCAEALALRKGFPGDEMGGLYIPEELDQAKTDTQAYSKEMVRDFPPGEPLRGLLVGIRPPDGTTPPKVEIQTLNGIMTHEVMGNEERYRGLVGCEVEYTYGKNGKFRPIQEMVLAPCVVQATSLDPVIQPSEYKKSLVDDYARHIIEVDSPTDQASIDEYAAQFSRGVVETVEEKMAKNGPYHRVKIGGVFGSVWHSPGHFGFESFEELIGQEVFYTKEEQPSKDGKKMFVTFHEIVPADIFNEFVISKLQEAEA